jgi:hypothetical protein
MLSRCLSAVSLDHGDLSPSRAAIASSMPMAWRWPMCTASRGMPSPSRTSGFATFFLSALAAPLPADTSAKDRSDMLPDHGLDRRCNKGTYVHIHQPSRRKLSCDRPQRQALAGRCDRRPSYFPSRARLRSRAALALRPSSPSRTARWRPAPDAPGRRSACPRQRKSGAEAGMRAMPCALSMSWPASCTARSRAKRSRLSISRPKGRSGMRR